MTEWSRRLGPRVRFGAFGVLSNAQAFVLIAGGCITLTVLSKGTAGWGLPAAIFCGGGVATVALKHRHGMPLADWIVKGLAYMSGRKRWEAKRVGRAAEQLPRELGDVRIVPVRDRVGVVGMLRERRSLTAVARVELHSLGLFDAGEQGRRLDAFRRILDSLAREDDPMFRVSLSTRRAPRAANAERAYLREHVVDLESPQARSMIAVVEDTRTVSHDHEFYLAVRYSIKQDEDGDGRMIDQTAAKLTARVRGLLERLERADIAVKTSRSLLDVPALARLVKDSFDPFGRDVRDRLEEATGLPGTDPTLAWPDSTHRYVDCYQTDGAYHATLWMRGWPAESVTPGWLTPLTLECDVPAMTVTTILKPEKKQTAKGRIKRKRTRGMSLRRVKDEHDVTDSEEQSDRVEFLNRQAEELAYRDTSAWWFEMYCTVSAPSRELLAESVKRATEACVDCGLTPVPLRLAMAEGFMFTLPLCRGLEPENARI